jgi:Ca-activated chloride channel family protein
MQAKCERLQAQRRGDAERQPPQDTAGIPVDNVDVTVDKSDIQALERRIDTQFESAQAEESGTRWRDEGFWLLWPMALLGASGFAVA